MDGTAGIPGLPGNKVNQAWREIAHVRVDKKVKWDLKDLRALRGSMARWGLRVLQDRRVLKESQGTWE